MKELTDGQISDLLDRAESKDIVAEARESKQPRIKFIFAWYDLWIGIFIDRKQKLIYFFPIPTLGIRFNYRKKSDSK